MTPLLVPAWTSVVRPGIVARVQTPTGVGPERVVVFVGEAPDGELWAHTAAMCESPAVYDWPVADLRLDLRDAAVRDAVARAMYRRIRRTTTPPKPGVLDMREVSPGVWEPVEPVWPGYLRFDRGWEGGAAWDWETATWSGCFASEPMPHDMGEVIVVPALAAVPLESPDRDLLALAACAAAVLS